LRRIGWSVDAAVRTCGAARRAGHTTRLPTAAGSGGITADAAGAATIATSSARAPGAGQSVDGVLPRVVRPRFAAAPAATHHHQEQHAETYASVLFHEQHLP